jgi:hypothetical protein
MAITTLAGVRAGMLPRFDVFKTSVATEGAGTWHSLWKSTGLPTAGATPPAFSAGSGYAPTYATTGAIAFANPASGLKYLAYLATQNASVTGSLILADRLWACSGFDTTSIVEQSITTPGDIPTGRDMNGATLGHGVELWGEVYTAPGATGATWTAKYTNQDGTTGKLATYTHPANAETVGQMFPFTLADGDTGVRSPTSFTADISSGTAGDIGLTLLRPIAEIPIRYINVRVALDAVQLGMPRLYDNSCLMMFIRPSSTVTGNILTTLAYAEG